MIAQKRCPLASFRYFGCLIENINNGKAILRSKSHVHPWHQREMEVHVTLIACAEIGCGIFRPLISFGKQHSVGVVLVNIGTQLLKILVGLGKIFAIGALCLIEIGNSIKPESINAHAEPEVKHVEKSLMNFRVLKIQIGLVVKETMPEILTGNRIPSPVGSFKILKNNTGF